MADYRLTCSKGGCGSAYLECGGGSGGLPGAGWYEYSLSIPEEWSGSRFRLHFEAVYRDAVVWVNGRKAGSHVNSGYTAFELEVTAHILHGKENRITVKADNSPAAQALPQSRSFDWADDGGSSGPYSL